MTDDENDRVRVAPDVFVRGCLLITVVAVACAAVMGAVAAFAIHRERDLALKSADSSRALADCTLDRARLRGRVHSFESVFITTKRTAIDAALREFGQQVGGETDKATLDQFAAWLGTAHP